MKSISENIEEYISAHRKDYKTITAFIKDIEINIKEMKRFPEVRYFRLVLQKLKSERRKTYILKKSVNEYIRKFSRLYPTTDKFIEDMENLLKNYCHFSNECDYSNGKKFYTKVLATLKSEAQYMANNLPPVLKVSYRAEGLVYGQYWGGGKGSYDSKKFSADDLQVLLDAIDASLKDGSLDSGMGYECLIGAIMEITTITTTEIQGLVFTNEQYEDHFFGDLTDDQREFLDFNFNYAD